MGLIIHANIYLKMFNTTHNDTGRPEDVLAGGLTTHLGVYNNPRRIPQILSIFNRLIIADDHFIRITTSDKHIRYTV